MTSSIKPEEGDGLGRSLKSRHVSMIAIGGIIGAGLFVGSSTSIATVGPAVVISYAIAGLLVLLVMRILSEMAISEPGVGSYFLTITAQFCAPYTDIVRITAGMTTALPAAKPRMIVNAIELIQRFMIHSPVMRRCV